MRTKPTPQARRFRFGSVTRRLNQKGYRTGASHFFRSAQNAAKAERQNHPEAPHHD